MSSVWISVTRWRFLRINKNYLFRQICVFSCNVDIFNLHKTSNRSKSIHLLEHPLLLLTSPVFLPFDMTSNFFFVVEGLKDWKPSQAHNLKHRVEFEMGFELPSPPLAADFNVSFTRKAKHGYLFEKLEGPVMRDARCCPVLYCFLRSQFWLDCGLALSLPWVVTTNQYLLTCDCFSRCWSTNWAMFEPSVLS